MPSGIAFAAIVVVVGSLDDDTDWTKLLLFAGIVLVAAWGFGRETKVAVSKPASACDESAPATTTTSVGEDRS